MSALAPLVGMPVAFKLGTALGVFLLPPLVYAGLRLMGFRFPSPILGTAAATVFLFLEDNPIWGGTIASTLTGEFCYTYGIGLAVLFLGVVYRTYAHGGRPWLPALVLATTALAHGYAVLWAGLSASYFLYGARRPRRTLGWLLAVAALAAALSAFWLLPLLAGWGWTTAYDDPWITVSLKNLFPPFLAPLFAAAVIGLLLTVLLARRAGGPDHRLLFLMHAALVAAALAAAGPALGIIDVRFVPFAQLALCLAGGVTLGRAVQSLRAPEPAALGLVLAALVYGDDRSRVDRYWIEWNYTGLEAKELWPAFRDLARGIRGSVADPRVAVEYSSEHEKAGSIRMYETLPLFSGRPTLEGVYNQASLQTHAVYYLASELDAVSPNPFKSREYSHLRHRQRPAPPAPVQRARRGGAEPEARLRPAGADGRGRGRAHPALHGLPARGSRTGLRGADGLRARALVAQGMARQGLPLVHAQAAPSRAPRLHRRPAVRGHGKGRVAGPAGGPARAGGHGG